MPSALAGKRVLVTRSREQAASAVALLEARGAMAVVVPMLEFRPASDPSDLERALNHIRAGAYAWTVFTSANGVDFTWRAVERLGGDPSIFERTRLAVVGPATADALAARGLRANLVSREHRASALADEMIARFATPDAASEARDVVVLRAAKAPDVLPQRLRSAGCRVDVVVAYETHAASDAAIGELTRTLGHGALDAVLFTSSSTVEHLCDRLGDRGPAILGGLCVASIGPVTSDTARMRGLRVDVTATESTLPALIEALETHYRARSV